MREIDWKNDSECSVGGLNFVCSISDFSLRTNAERIVLLKNRDVLNLYWSVLAADSPRNVFEFGVFQGGSPALFSVVFDVEKYVAVDISPPVDAFEASIREHPVGRVIRTHYGVSQADQERVAGIIDGEFGDTPIDLIIDDASHMYEPTRQAFEVAFPRLRPGGTYVIEDWGWAHWPGSQAFLGKKALSILIIELMMICASRPDIISEMRVFNSFAFIRKAKDAPQLVNMSVESLYEMRGMELRGVQETAAAPPSQAAPAARDVSGPGIGHTGALRAGADWIRRAITRPR